MTGIARYVSDPEIKQLLRETDGIGTPATQAAIIQTLFDRRYIESGNVRSRRRRSAAPHPAPARRRHPSGHDRALGSRHAPCRRRTDAFTRFPRRGLEADRGARGVRAIAGCSSRSGQRHRDESHAGRCAHPRWREPASAFSGAVAEQSSRLTGSCGEHPSREDRPSGNRGGPANAGSQLGDVRHLAEVFAPLLARLLAAVLVGTW